MDNLNDLNITEYDIAKYIYYKNKNKYIYNVKTGWYTKKFDKNNNEFKLHKIENGYMRLKIADEINNLHDQYIQNLDIKTMNYNKLMCEDVNYECLRKEISNDCNKIHLLKGALKYSYRNNIIKNLQDFFLENTDNIK